MNLRLFRIDDGEIHVYAAEGRSEAIDLHYAWMEPERNLADWDIRELDPAEPLQVRMVIEPLSLPAEFIFADGLVTASAAAWAKWAGRPTQVSSTCF